jgi:hypothetical protein
VISDRGEEITDKVTDDVFEISFWVIYSLLIDISHAYELKNRREGTNSRQVAFQKRLELLGKVGENYRKRGEIEISEILALHPY